MICTILECVTHPLVALLLGSAITWVVAWWYYKRAGDELRIESKRLLQTSNLILAFMENRAAVVAVDRDAEGMPTGLTVTASGASASISTASGSVVKKHNS